MARKRKWRPTIPRAKATANGVFSYKTKRGGTGVHKTLQTQFEGLDAFDLSMDRLYLALSDKVLDQAIEDASEVFEELQAELAPRDRSRLALGIRRQRVRSDTVFTDSHAEWDSGPRGKVFYGMFQELGTIYSPAQPFMRPAFDEGKASAEGAFRSRLQRGIRRAARG